MQLENKRLAVIGGAGLIGSHTVDQLLKHDVKEVVIYDNFVRGTKANLANALKDSRVSVFEAGGDILQTDILNDALTNIDGVFHFAALWLLQCHEYPVSAFETNVKGTFNVMDACRKQGVKRLVYSSSASVYGDAITEPMTEEHPFNNQTFYGATKIAGEAMLTSYWHRYELPFAGLRYMNVYGPRQDYKGAYIAVIMKMLDSIEKGEPMKIYGDGSQAYDFVYVEDCARANICAMQNDLSGNFYNVGTGIRTSILELAQLVQEITNTKDNIEFIPQGQTFVKNRIGCPEKAKTEISFEAKTKLKDGLTNLIKWRNEQKN